MEILFFFFLFFQGSTIIFPFWDLFRNADEFDDPGSFKPERFISKEAKHTKVINFGLGKVKFKKLEHFVAFRSTTYVIDSDLRIQI